jgi:hypothetical protein
VNATLRSAIHLMVLHLRRGIAECFRRERELVVGIQLDTQRQMALVAGIQLDTQRQMALVAGIQLDTQRQMALVQLKANTPS